MKTKNLKKKIVRKMSASVKLLKSTMLNKFAWGIKMNCFWKDSKFKKNNSGNNKKNKLIIYFKYSPSWTKDHKMLNNLRPNLTFKELPIKKKFNHLKINLNNKIRKFNIYRLLLINKKKNMTAKFLSSKR